VVQDLISQSNMIGPMGSHSPPDFGQGNAGFPRNDAYHLKKKKTGLPEGHLWLVDVGSFNNV
jgi:hypothetical protein